MFSSYKRIMDAANSSSQAQPRLLTCRSCGRAARRSSVLLGKRKIRCSLCPDHCRAIVPCEIVPGQTQPLLHETFYCGNTLWPAVEGLPVLDAALDVFLTFPGHTSTREDKGQLVVEGV